MSGGRAASAIASRRAKQELVRLLFSTEISKAQAPFILRADISSYTYRDLRTAYLQKLHELHPDKAVDARVAKGLFVELQTAWLAYQEISKTFRQSSPENHGVDANFTMFGVGCSFSDSEQEKSLRSEIMDQACRGWFSSGYIEETGTVRITSTDKPVPPLFTLMEEEKATPCDEESTEDYLQGINRHKSSLVSDRPFGARRRIS